MLYQLNKIEELLSEDSIEGFSLEEIIDKYCIHDWKYRGRCTNCEEIRGRLSIFYKDIKSNSGDLNVVLNYLEYITNLIWLCNTKFLQGRDDFDVEYQYLQENVIGLILLALADKFEPMRNELKKVNATLESNIGYLLNKMNIRHNN